MGLRAAARARRSFRSSASAAAHRRRGQRRARARRGRARRGRAASDCRSRADLRSALPGASVVIDFSQRGRHARAPARLPRRAARPLLHRHHRLSRRTLRARIRRRRARDRAARRAQHQSRGDAAAGAGAPAPPRALPRLRRRRSPRRITPASAMRPRAPRSRSPPRLRAGGARSGRRAGPASRSPRCARGRWWGSTRCSFCGAGEQLSLTHRATDRAIFARGALAAALWLAPRPPGRYAMRDVLVGKTDT